MPPIPQLEVPIIDLALVLTKTFATRAFVSAIIYILYSSSSQPAFYELLWFEARPPSRAD